MGGPHAQPLGDGAGRELGAAMYGGLEVGSSTCRGRVLMLNYSADVQALEATNQRWSRTTPRNPRPVHTKTCLNCMIQSKSQHGQKTANRYFRC